MSEKPNSLQSLALKCAGVLAVALLATAGPAAAQVPVGTAFTYEGQLLQGGNPVNDTCEFEFSLWDDGDPLFPENQVGSTLLETVIVEDGLLTVVLDFGAFIFTGDARWLEIAVCCPPDNCTNPPTNFTTLLPRQELTPAPYSLRASNGVGGPGALHVNATDSIGIGTTTPSTKLDVIGNILAAGTLSSANAITINGTNRTIRSNDILELHTSQGRNLRLEPGGPNVGNRIAPNVIAGFEGNTVGPGVLGATIAGGGADDLDPGEGPFPNEVFGEWGTVSGGYSNIANGFAGTVGGGSGNNAGNDRATVGGGGGNVASGTQSTVGGGIDNTADGEWSTVGGGKNNDASGGKSTVGGGEDNAAGGDWSTIGGGQDNTATDDHSTIGGGLNNTANDNAGTVGGGQTNIAGAMWSTVGGGLNNSALNDGGTVGGGQLNIAGGVLSTVGGGDTNNAGGNQSTIGGGNMNTAGGNGSTIGGGDTNTAGGNWSTLGGGRFNHATGVQSTIGGGIFNDADGVDATVGGGQDNDAEGDQSTIGGGRFNIAGGVNATVPGGFGNWANGDYSFAAGRGSQAIHTGTFVWSDSTFGSFTSTASEQFLIRADGGVGIGLNNPVWALEVQGSGINLKNAAGADRVLLTETALFSGFVGTKGPNGNANIWLTHVDIQPDVGIVAVLDANGNDNILLTSSAESASTGAVAVWGENGNKNVDLSHLSGSPNNGAIWIYDAAGTNQAAMYVDGAGDGRIIGDHLTVSGHISGGSIDTALKNFKIDHPIDPGNKYLYHSCVESPDMMNVYNGNVVTDGNGEVWVELPSYFQALNQDFRYQLTVIGQFAQVIVGTKIKDNRFSIRTDKPNVEVSWQVTGVRKDAFAEAHRTVVEVDKPENERGHYLYPEVFGKSAELRISSPALAAVAAATAGPAAPQAPAEPAPDFQGQGADLDPPFEE